MLVEFCVGNYRSFLEPVTFSMVAASLRSQDKDLDARNVFDATPRLRLLTSAAIYGANASGKSNLVQAMQFMREFVLRSTEGTDPTGGIPVERFRLSPETVGRPSFFQTAFLLEGVRYRYGFEVTSERVAAEWLYFTPKSVETRLFERRVDEFDFGPKFREGKDFVEKVRPNALFLSTAGQWNNRIAAQLIGWFRKSLWVGSVLTDSAMRGATLMQLRQTDKREPIVELVRRFDLGIADVVLETTPLEQVDMETLLSANSPGLNRVIEVLSRQQRGSTPQEELVSVKTVHTVQDGDGALVGVEQFDLQKDESEGTKKLFSMAGPLLDVLRRGRVLIIDELDARLHPLITRAIIALFNSPESNPHHAQLIFATHDTNLLDRRYFRRDQVWFTEKDRRGATQLYSLAEFRVRNDASYGRDYIRGKYGAVPYLGQLERLADEGSAALSAGEPPE